MLCCECVLCECVFCVVCVCYLGGIDMCYNVTDDLM